MGTLAQAGVITFLRENGVPIITDGGESINKAAIAAAASAGYNKCLDDLLNFKERFILIKENISGATPDYGATQAAIQRGDISKEEADAIRSNQQFDYTKHTASTKAEFDAFQRKRLEHNAKSGA